MVRAEFLTRLNRFAILVRVEGKEEAAHLPNPGRLLEVLTPGREVLLRPGKKGRRTRWTAVAADLGPFLVSLDSTLPNRAFPRFLALGILPELRDLEILAKEPKLGSGRADFLLGSGERRVWVEVKSVTLVEDGVALFPDAPTVRGRRHLLSLAERARAGEEALVVFVVQRPDAQKFGPNSVVDPHFAQVFCAALEAGVEAKAVVCSFDGEDLHPLAVLGSEALVLPAPCAQESPALP
ncbi:DNA/RNA nuclease SfsA [Candidatus Bipolaricaulota bacterium]|nr:DNA/RNA nuclease SfsA [Candidatus Bipolaricaulota bacterium]